MIIDPRLNKGFNRVLFFFPLQLVFLQLRKNHILLIFWAIIFAYITKNLGVKYGFHHLFLYPEYLGQVGFYAHLILGFSCGIFVMAYNISSYILNGFRFPFIATLNRPFIKFCLNNTLIPGSFFLTYVIGLIAFQADSQLSNGQITVNIIGFVAGNLIFLATSLLYFFFTNTTVYKLFGRPPKEEIDGDERGPLQDVFHKKRPWYKMFNNDREWRVGSYLSSPFKIKIARSSKHYDKDMLNKVYAQHHNNASYFQIGVIAALLIIGIFRENPFLEIPAGASIFLVLAIFIMLFSAIYSWLKQWSVITVVIVLLIINQLTSFDNNYYKSEVYGLDYSIRPAMVTDEVLLKEYTDQPGFEKDYKHGLEMLENWRAKFPEDEKPKLVFVNCSGGGLRAGLWTTLALREADKRVGSDLMDHSIMITGASGGMVGAAYLRELYIKHRAHPERIDSLTNSISKDLLNPVAVNLAMYDMFFRFQEFKYKDKSYSKDRGYSFERKLFENTNGLLDKPISAYEEAEYRGLIPTMVFSPTVVNDGKRLLISSQPIAYLTRDDVSLTKLKMKRLPEAIEFSKLFAQHGAEDVKLSTLLRMSSTFPYVFPAASLPTEPELEVMDAGIRDNYGVRLSLNFISVYQDWINKNTSGVIIVQTRDVPKNFESRDASKKGIFSQMASPLGAFYQNWPKIQDFDQDEMIEVLARSLDVPTDVVPLELTHSKDDYISLSWHLTKEEITRIQQSIDRQEFQDNCSRLKILLK